MMNLLKPLLEIVGFLVLLGGSFAVYIWFVWRPRVRRWERENSGELKRKPISDGGILFLMILIMALFGWGLFYFIGKKLG